VSASRRLRLVGAEPTTAVHAASSAAKVDGVDGVDGVSDADRVDAADRSGSVGDDPRALLQRVARGDEAAFGRFYDLVAPAVHGVVLRVLRDPAMAEETTQDVFVELWRLAPRYDPSRGSPARWAVTVAHRRAVDRVRSEQAARDRDDVEARRADVAVAGVAEQVVDAASAELDRARVAAALTHLTDVQREALTLAYYGGHTYREVAVLLDVPEGTVKTRIRDALIKLRDLMGVTP
jgi:RNA polymerase sigma-70 factor (ECF subfamily)